MLAYDEILLREPNLLIPGRKPVGPVRVDWSHPLARDLRAFWLLSGGGMALDVTGRYNMPADTVVPGRGMLDGQPALLGASVSGSHYELNEPVIDDLTDGYTVAARWGETADSVNAVHGVFYQGTFSSDVGLAVGAWQSVGGGDLYFRPDNGTFNDVDNVLPPDSSPPTSVTAVCGIGAGSTYDVRAWVDGASVLNTTSSGTKASQSGNKTIIGAWYVDQGDRHFEGSISFVVVWRRLLSDAEAAAFHRSPMQMLVPA